MHQDGIENGAAHLGGEGMAVDCDNARGGMHVVQGWSRNVLRCEHMSRRRTYCLERNADAFLVRREGCNTPIRTIHTCMRASKPKF